MSPACSLVRGTSTFQPYSALDSHQDSALRDPAALPTVTTNWPLVSPVSEASEDRVVSWVRCVLKVPLLVTATGVVPSSPCPINSADASARWLELACRINGCGAAAAAAQSTSLRASNSVWVPPSATPA